MTILNYSKEEESKKRKYLLELDYIKNHLKQIEPEARAYMQTSDHQNYKAWLLEYNWKARINWLIDNLDNTNNVVDAWLKHKPFQHFIPTEVAERINQNTRPYDALS